MKFSNSTIICLLTIVISFSVLSCSSDDYSSPLKGKTISDLTFESSQSSNSVSIGDTDFSKCTATSSELWCIASISGKSVNVTVQGNDTYGERQATVTITDSEDNTSISFKVIQKQNDAIMIDDSTYTIPEEGGEVSINIQSNVGYTIEIPSDASWLSNSNSSTRAFENSTLVLKASKNDSGDEREAVIKLTDSSSGTSSQFTVKQELTPYATIDKNEFTLDETGGEIEVIINSNVAIGTSFRDSWVIDGGITETDNFSFVQKIKVSALTRDESSRSTTVGFISKLSKWNINLKVTINQINSLSIKDSDVKILIGKNYSLNVINNTDSSLSWESSDTSVVTVDNNGKITGIGIGSAIITVTSTDGKHSAQCSITVQDISDFIITRAGGGSVMMINGLIKYGSSLGWYFINNSSETVRLKSLQLIDGMNGYEGNIMSVDEDVTAGSSVSYYTTIGLLGIHAPVTCIFRYEYNGKEYITTAVYSSLF